MSLRRLQTLLTIARCGSLTAAAEIECVTRSAISQQMKVLESELGRKLFDRSKRPPELNPLGRAIIPMAEEILEKYKALENFLHGDVDVSGELTIGAMFTAMTGVVPHAMKAIRQAYPNLHIQASPGHSAGLMVPVDRGLIDAAFITRPASLASQMIFREVAKEPFVLITPVDCRLDDPREILAHYPFIRISRSLWSGQAIDKWLVGEKMVVSEAMELDGIQMISTMVYHQLGVSIVPKRCVQVPNPVPVREIALTTMPPRVVGLLSRLDSPKQHMIEVLYDRLRAVVQTYQALLPAASDAASVPVDDPLARVLDTMPPPAEAPSLVLPGEPENDETPIEGTV